MRLGSTLAALNVDAIAAPSVAEMARLRRNPVMRLTSVAIAIDPVERTTSASEACWPASAVVAWAAAGVVAALGTGAGGAGSTIRLLAPWVSDTVPILKGGT